MSNFEKLKDELKNKLIKAQSSQEVDIIRTEIFGKNGLINSEFKKLGSLSPEDKKKLASEINTAKQQLTKLFKYIHYRWVVTQNSGGFFSYNWLLHFCLVLLESPLIIYLKPPTCKKRSDKYLEKLGSILPLKNDETMNRDTISTHLLNEL